MLIKWIHDLLYQAGTFFNVKWKNIIMPCISLVILIRHDNFHKAHRDISKFYGNIQHIYPRFISAQRSFYRITDFTPECFIHLLEKKLLHAGPKVGSRVRSPFDVSRIIAIVSFMFFSNAVTCN